MAAAVKQPKSMLFAQDQLSDEPEAGELEEGTTPAPEAPAEPAAEPAPAPEAEPEPEAKAEPRGAEKRIKELLEQGQAKDRELQQLRENWARLDERQRQAQQAREEAGRIARQAEQNQNPYDPQLDPVGHKTWELEHKLAAMEQWRQQQEQYNAQIQQVYTQDQQQRQLESYIVAQTQAYQQVKPDYLDAMNYIAQAELNLWLGMGYPAEQAKQIVLAKGQALAAQAMQQGKSFPETVYNIAVGVGYKPRTANGNGKAISPQVSAAARTLNQAKNGQALQGLNRAPAAAQEGATGRYLNMTAAEIAAVPDAVWQRDWKNPALQAEMELALRRLDGVTDEYNG